jgi:hypothetical protein
MRKVLFTIASLLAAVALLAALPTPSVALPLDTIDLYVDASSGSMAWNSSTFTASNIKVSDITGVTAGNLTVTYPTNYSNMVLDITATYTGVDSSQSAFAHGVQTQAGYSFSGGTFQVIQIGPTPMTNKVFLSGTLDSFDLIAKRTGTTASKIEAASVQSSLDATFENGILLPAIATYYNILQTVSGDVTMDVNRINLGTNSVNLPGSPQTLLAHSVTGKSLVTPFISNAHIDMSVTSAVPIPGAFTLLAPGLLGLVGLRKRFFG